MASPKQCKSFSGALSELDCQGERGHDGPHWAFSAAGHLIEWKNKKDKSEDWKNISERWSPPDSQHYSSPQAMDEKWYMRLYVNSLPEARSES